MKVITNNRKAFFDYFISDCLEAGIALVGSEVKSVRAGNISLKESFVFLRDGEIYLKNAYIKPYEQAANFVPDCRRDRKLLLNKSEINSYAAKVQEKGFSIVPLQVYLKGNKVKVEIGLAKGKKLYDKRQTLKERQVEKDLRMVSKVIKR